MGDDECVAAGDDDINMLAAALRADEADVEVFARVLAKAVVEALPASMVTVEHERSWADRMARRPASVSRVTVRTRWGDLELASPPGRTPTTAVAYRLHDAVVARRVVPVTEWALLLVEELRSRSTDSAAERAALERLLGG